MLQHAHGCGFLIKKCDVKGGGEGGGQKVNVIVTLRSAKVVCKCPLSQLVSQTKICTFTCSCIVLSTSF